MVEIGLQCSGIDALIGQRVAAGMPWGWTLNPILASSPARASSLAKPDVCMDHHASTKTQTARPVMLRLPQCWFNPRCRGGEHTAQEAWSCNRSLGND